MNADTPELSENESDVLERDFFMETALEKARLAMVASDMRQEGQPITYVNDAFIALSGYTRDEIIGRNCRFLQGPNTSQKTVDAIREAINKGEEGYFEIVNYRKDGTEFWSGLHIGPVYDADNNVFLFFGSQRDVTIEVEARKTETLRAQELRHRLSNLMAIVAAIVRNSPIDADEQSLRAVLEARISALGVSTDLLFPKYSANDSADLSLVAQHVEVDTIVETILRPFGVEHRTNLAGGPAALLNVDVTNVALCLNELATNASKYGALSVEDGKLNISWQVVDDRVQVDWIESNGPPAIEPTRKGMGSRLLRGLLMTSKRDDAGILFKETGLEFRFDARVEIG